MRARRIVVLAFLALAAGFGIAMAPSILSAQQRNSLRGPGASVAPTRTITAGAGLTGGGDLSANRTIDVGPGTGITVAADTVAVDTTVISTRAYADTGDATAISTAETYADGGDVKQRYAVGPYIKTPLAASQTDTKITPGSGAPDFYLVFMRPGSVVGISVDSHSFAITGSDVKFRVMVEHAGSLTALTAYLTLSVGTKGNYITWAAGTYPYVAGDRLVLAYTTDGSFTNGASCIIQALIMVQDSA